MPAISLGFPDGSVHLVVTSPPYWTLKEYTENERQMGAIEDYDRFLDELDRVWAECLRVLSPGGRICCVVGDVCLPRKKAGRHYVMPLHADIQVRSRGIGLDCLTPILWHKIANGVTEAEGNGAGFYGKPYQPGAVVKKDIEYILFMRKGGSYRTPPHLQEDNLKRIAVRKAPLWNQGLIEGIWLIRIDSRKSAGSRIVDTVDMDAKGTGFFTALLDELYLREPTLKL